MMDSDDYYLQFWPAAETRIPCEYRGCEDFVGDYPENPDKHVALCPAHQTAADEYPCYRCGTTSRLDWESEGCCELCRTLHSAECIELQRQFDDGEQSDGELMRQALLKRKAAFRERLSKILGGPK